VRIRIALSLALLGCGSVVPALRAAPDPLPPAGSVALTPAAPGNDAAEFDDLIVLPDDHVIVRYPPESLDRAARVQTRLVEIDRLWSMLVPRPLGWSAVILQHDTWQNAGLGGIWGAPLRLAPGLFALPAAGDAGTVKFARALLGGNLPDPGGVPMMGTSDEAASLVVTDLLLQIEAARDFVELAPLSGDAPWVKGVLMQLAVRYAWERIEPGMTLGYVALWDALSAAQGGPRAHRLADYRDGLPYETELWYQAQFVRGADAIWIETSWMVSHRLYKWAHKGQKGEPVTVAELEKKYPALVDWEKNAFAP